MKPISDDHHVVRHCQRRHVWRRRADKKPIGVFPDFFRLRGPNPPFRDEPEKYLSAVYFEIAADDQDKRWSKCRASLFALGKGDAYARLSVGRIKGQGLQGKKRLKVMHEPKERSPLYSAIRGLPPEVDMLLNALLTDAVVEMQD